MNNEEIIQLMHEAYHSVERIAEWAGVPVHYIERLYMLHLVNNP